MKIDLRQGDCLQVLKSIPSESVSLIITSPPYYNLRDYNCDGQIGIENNVDDYLFNLVDVFRECYRVLRKDGSFWLNIADVYEKSCLLCIPDRIKLKILEIGFFCRNEIIWHKPNSMPSSAKNRFNNDYEKFYFFTKSRNYYFNTQYEPTKTKIANRNHKSSDSSKYLSIEQESSVRQGMNRSRGSKIIEVRKHLPSQQEFVNFMRKQTSIGQVCENVEIKRTQVEHWFRRDKGGFSYPSVDDWNRIKFLVDDFSEEFNNIDFGLTTIDYETDDIYKNIKNGRIKRAVWSISTKPFKGCHYAPFPTSLVETPILACSREKDVVLDPFMGSGTVGVVCKKLNRNFIGIDLNNEYIKLAEKRIKEAQDGDIR